MKITFKKSAIALIVLVIIGGIIQERIGSRNTTATSTGSTFESLVGKPAPKFTLTDRDGNSISNDSLKGKKVLLFFNEGLACYPACWNQMIELNKDERLKKDDTVIFSVVTDSPSSWKQATEKMSDLAIVNVAFDEGSASKDFGATTVPSTMHTGQAGHSYVIIDKDGEVRWVLDDPRMAINNGAIYAQLSKLQ